jgi:hypothetical protein
MLFYIDNVVDNDYTLYPFSEPSISTFYISRKVENKVKDLVENFLTYVYINVSFYKAWFNN